MKINVYAISKKERDEYESISDSFIQMSKRWAEVTNNNIFTKEITKRQNLGEVEARESYNSEFSKYLKGYNIVLDPLAKMIDSYAFADLLKDRQEINFFIGGAYGFESGFINKCDKSISLSPLTFSHKMAKILLFEQIYRGLSINNNHPYHKI
jgi:23S rRNA (pseudouridine1915-N3)-methyltransferase